MARKKQLSDFEGEQVHTAGLEIRNAAGGLNEAMKVDPAEWHKDEEIHVVMRCKVDKIRFDPVKDMDGWKRVHILSASEATVIDGALVAEALDEQAKRIEEAAGVRRLQLEDETKAAHDRGEHKKLVDDCPLCTEEKIAADAEAAGKVTEIGKAKGAAKTTAKPKAPATT